MLEDLDETLKTLLIEKVPLDQAEVDISFDVPNRDWSKSISKPTINIYLHDIRENVSLRYSEWTTERDAHGRVTRTLLGARFDLSYLITAWTTNVEDEHRLLWYVLATLMRYKRLPEEVLQGPLKTQPYPLETKIAQPDSILRNAADVWTALDNQLKPVLPLVVTVSLEPHIFTISKEVRSKFIRFNPPDELPKGEFRHRWNDPLETIAERKKALGPVADAVYTQIGGRVRDVTHPDRPVQAEVILLEQGLNVRTDKDGRFSFSNIITGRSSYTFLAIAPGYVTARKTLPVPGSSYDLELEPETVAVA